MIGIIIKVLIYLFIGAIVNSILYIFDIFEDFEGIDNIGTGLLLAIIFWPILLVGLSAYALIYWWLEILDDLKLKYERRQNEKE